MPPPVFTLSEKNRGLEVSGFSAKLKKLRPCSIRQMLVNSSHLPLDWLYILRRKSEANERERENKQRRKRASKQCK